MMTVIESKLKLIRNAKVQIQKEQFTNSDLLTLLEKFRVRGGDVSYNGGMTEQTNALGDKSLSTSFEMSVSLSKKEATMIGAAFQGNKGLLDFDSTKKLKRETNDSFTFKVASKGDVTSSIMSKPRYTIGTNIEDKAKYMLIQSVLRGIVSSGLYQMDPSISYMPKHIDIDDKSMKDPADAMLLMRRVYLPYNKEINQFIDDNIISQGGQGFPNATKVVFAESLKNMFREGLDDTAELVRRYKRVQRQEAKNTPVVPEAPKTAEIHDVQHAAYIPEIPDMNKEPESMFRNVRRAM
jgi:hypothetical protein